MFKLDVGHFSPEEIRKGFPGVEVLSQEEGGYALAFASHDALEEFEARLSTLAKGQRPRYVNVLYALRAFEHWSEDDRKGWALNRDGMPRQAPFMLDVELWPVALKKDREALIRAFQAWLAKEGIIRLDWINTEGLLLYRVNVNPEQAAMLLRHRDVRTVDLPPRLGLELQALHMDVQDLPDMPAPPESAPLLAVLDSGLATNHPLLKPAIADAQGFMPPDMAAHDDAGHGTHVAGIALYGDVEECWQAGEFAPGLRLLSGRILDERAEANTRLIENLVEESVRYFHENYGCRVFNLSYGDWNKPYLGGRMHGLAYTLDRLSRELDILFVVPTGNLHDAPDEWLRDEYPGYLLRDESRLLDPAPALNALTVGSLARWDQNFNAQRHPNDPREHPIAQRDQPSPFSRCGESVKGAIKPELVAYGGNWAVNRANGHIVQRGMGELSTSKDFAGGRVLAEESGTSFAAPHVAHLAARLLSEIPANASMNLVRALLVANARRPRASVDLWKDDEGKLGQSIGYGMVDPAHLFRSTEEEVILIAEAGLANKRHHFYEIPIPDSFTAGPHKSRTREITVAMAYCPLTRTTRIDYRAVRMMFRLVEGADLDEVSAMFDKATPKEDYENIPEVGSGQMRRAYGAAKRAKGTVQATTWTLKRARKERLFVVITRNDHGWSEIDADEAYALVIRIGDRENEQARLYTQIRAQLQLRQRERARGRAEG